MRIVVKTFTYRCLGIAFGYWLGTMFNIPPYVNLTFNVVSNAVATIVYYFHDKFYERYWKS